MITEATRDSLTYGRQLPLWAFIRRYRQKQQARFRAAVSAEVDRRVDLVCREAVERINASRARHEDVLKARRAERAWEGFAPIAVTLRGFRNDSGDQHYVLIEVNRRTGQLRAAKPGLRQILRSGHHPGHDNTSDGWFSGGGWERDRLFGFSPIGSPTWSKIDGDSDAIVLLGEVYRFNGQHRMTGLGNAY